jgi:hypothetical protein
MDALYAIDPEVLFPALAVFASGLANLILLFLPVPGEGSGGLYKGFYTLVNWIALNVGKAKNAVTAAPAAAPKRNE